MVSEVQPLIDTVRTDPRTSIFDPILSEDGLTLFISTDAVVNWSVLQLTRPSLSEPFDHIALGPSDVNVIGVYPFGYQPLDSLDIALTFGAYAVPGLAAGTPVIVLADSAEPPRIWRPVGLDFTRSLLGDPRLTGDGTGLVFASVADTIANNRGIFFSERTLLNDDFTDIAQFDTLSAEDDSAPWLSTDRRVMFFAHAASAAGADQQTSDIWVATRSDPNGPFTDVTPLDVLSSPYFDGEPYLYDRNGMCELYIVATLPENPGFLLYRSVMQP